MEIESNMRSKISGGTGRSRLVVLSLPKSGTYLVAEVLKDIGFKPTYWHLHEESYEDYSHGTKEAMLQCYSRFTIVRPLEATISALPEGTFAVGHLPSNRRCIAAMQSVESCLLVRELRTAIVSRFFFEKGARRGDRSLANPEQVALARDSLEAFLRSQGRRLINQADRIAGWRSKCAIPTIQFEEVRAESDRAIDLLARIAGHDVDSIKLALHNALQRGSLTKSVARLPMEAYWTPKCEHMFLRWGGNLVNVSLGYGEAPTPGIASRLRRWLSSIP